MLYHLWWIKNFNVNYIPFQYHLHQLQAPVHCSLIWPCSDLLGCHRCHLLPWEPWRWWSLPCEPTTPSLLSTRLALMLLGLQTWPVINKDGSLVNIVNTMVVVGVCKFIIHDDWMGVISDDQLIIGCCMLRQKSAICHNCSWCIFVICHLYVISFLQICHQFAYLLIKPPCAYLSMLLILSDYRNICIILILFVCYIAKKTKKKCNRLSFQ